MKNRYLSFILAASGLVLTACGQGSSSALSGSGTQSDSHDPSSGNKWIIVTDTVFKPFEYTDSEGNFTGIDVDILSAIAEDQGFEYELKSLGWDASIEACKTGKADGMIAGASITEERKNDGWIFSDGYYDANQSMAVKADADVTGFDDIKSKSVAVKTGTLSAVYAEELASEYDLIITYFEDSPTMYQAVIGGQVAACFDDTPIMASTIKDTGIAMKIVDGTGNEPASYGFAIFDKKNQELIDMFNAGLAHIKENGKYDEIINKYLGE